MKLWAACLLLLGFALAATEVRPPANAAAAPGEYATLLFSIWGRGEVRLAALTPEDWQVLPLPKVLQIKERVFVALTVRVPELTPAGSRHPLVLQAWAGERLLSQATAYVTVKPKADIILYLENKQHASIGEPFSYRVTVINRGNQTDRITLEAESNTGEHFVSPTVLELEPGEEGRAKLTLQIEEGRRVSPGYTMITWVRAHSENGGFTRKVRATTRWLDPLALAGRGPDPTLTLAVSGSFGLGGRLEAGIFGPLTVNYSVRPAISGQLSDYVTGRAEPAAIYGQSPGWWPAAPRNVAASLKGPSWDAALAATANDLRLQLGFNNSSWRYSLGARGRYDAATFGLNLSAISKSKDLNLQWSAGSQLHTNGRKERFSINYSRPLGENISLRLGGRLSGIMTQTYTLVGSARQGLLWQNRRFSVLQQLSATPQLGLYTLTLTGGTRSVYPLGARASAHLQSAGGALSWKTSTSLFATPLSRTSLRISAALENPLSAPLQVTFNPSLGLKPPSFAGLQSSFSLGYKLAYQPAAGDLQQTGLATAQMRFSRFSLSASASYTFSGPPAYGAKLGLSWRPLPLTVLNAAYHLKSSSTYSAVLKLGWQQYWGAGFASRLDVEHAGGQKAGDRISLYLAQKSIFESPFGLVLGYSLRDPDGLGRGEAILSHNFSIQLGFDLAWQFDTPEPVVALFGGRRVGEVSGIAYIDRNLNGVKDPGEPAVAGLGIALGGAGATTDASGRYRLLSRPGLHKPRLSKLPATLDLYREIELQVEESKSYQLDLPLAPTAQIAVLLFHDANHNGRHDEGEYGIPYGGVRFVGPSQRSLRTNERGVALATGLLPGEYTIEPDPNFLPPRFSATAAATKLELAPGKAEEPLALGAAPPPKQVKTTYIPGKLAVFVNLPNPIVAAGGEIDVQAIVQGEAEHVWLRLAGVDYPLEPSGGGRYQGNFRIPRETPTGSRTITVVASRGTEKSQGVAVLTVVQRVLYNLDPLKAVVGSPHNLALTLLFRAENVRLRVGDETIKMASEDGYHWTAAWTPKQAGSLALQPLADGEALAPTQLRVFPAADNKRQGRK